MDSHISRERRETLLGQRGAVVWFTGLPGAGKSTLATTLEEWLIENGKLAYLLDGDKVRCGLNRDLTFSTRDREENIRRIAEVANLLSDCGVICISAFISPFDKSRQFVEDVVGRERTFIVYVSTPIELCERRDPKGLYAKARRGEILDFTGIDSPYEVPQSPRLTLNTAELSKEQCLEQLLGMLRTAGVV